MKKWYIKINGQQEGPYTLQELRRDRRILPETPVREEKSTEWRPIGSVKELREVFKDEEQRRESTQPVDLPGPSGEGILTRENQHPGFGWLIWIIVILLVWLFYQSL